ncbi:hypothetical protein [Paludisphaera rhizosphaerae]|uniref:hypothetical protein n=1 Tax=Paludisphaera rhizosphaerae TaxID=2711216 RepID=UPI0013EBBD99|nr:hypothetical protein [Paludisphaera rhizosphaerae]
MDREGDSSGDQVLQVLNSVVYQSHRLATHPEALLDDREDEAFSKPLGQQGAEAAVADGRLRKILSRHHARKRAGWKADGLKNSCSLGPRPMRQYDDWDAE